MSAVLDLVTVLLRIAVAGFAAKAVSEGAYGSATFLALVFIGAIGADIARAIREPR